MLRRQLLTACMMTLALIVLVGIAYPLVVTGVAQAFMGNRANGSLVKANGKVVGSSLIGQSFTDAKGNPLPQYFEPRPSAAGDGYDAMKSGGSNLGPSNTDLINSVQQRVAEYRRFNGIPAGAPVPSDAVTASASGLDPGISLANARLQAPRIARVRNLDIRKVTKVIADHTQGRPFGVLGEQTVNVLAANLDLDRMH